MDEPEVSELGEALRVLGEWQYDGAPVPLHPGDLGWHWRLGAQATAAAVRTWSRDGRLVAVGLLDGPGLLRLAVAPEARLEEEVARQLVTDITGPHLLPPGEAAVEARFGGTLHALLFQEGWEAGEPWTPLVRSLAEPVADGGLRIEVAGPGRTAARVEVQRAAFDGSSFTDQRWQAMAAGPGYAAARCLVGFDGQGSAVATATVWSAGPGRPGLLEPVGVHREHRGRGFGTAITVAAAATLRQLGSSSAIVCTPSANAGGVATYRAAGFDELPQVRDLRRPAEG